MAFAERPEPGTHVHVEFDGVVDEDETNLADKFWQVLVTEDHLSDHTTRIHLINWESDFVTETAPPSRTPQPGEVWRANGENHLHINGFMESESSSYYPHEFLDVFPDAELIIDAEGARSISATDN